MNRCKTSFIFGAAAWLLAAGQVVAADAPAAVPSGVVASPARTAAPEVLPALPSGRSHTVVRGDTLDRVIQKTLADSPLRLELIRQAFIHLNPQAFPNGRMVPLKVGSVLQVPDGTQMVRSVLLPLLEGAEAAAVVRNGTPQTGDERRRWVRFP